MVLQVVQFCKACNSKQAAGGMVDNTGLRVDHASNATVLVQILKDMKDEHQTHFSDIKVGVGSLVTIMILIVVAWCVSKAWGWYGMRQEAFIERRANSIIRRYQTPGNQPRGSSAIPTPSNQHS